ncbi:MAG: Fur family transcriptional regulator [Acidimicrobiia bacterium]
MEKLSEHLHNLSISELEKIGSRLTSAREKLLIIFESNNMPLTVIDIEQKSPSIAKSSLYRNLGVLEDAGLITKIVNENDYAYYELTENVIGHHHHLRCSNCNEVIDIEISNRLEKELEKLTESISAKKNYSKSNHHLEFVGTCSKCS